MSHLFCNESENLGIDEFLPLGNEIIKETKQILLPSYPNAFNPSILKVDQGFLMTFRFSRDPHKDPTSYIGIVLLNDSFDVISEPELLNTRNTFSKTPTQSEDARLFTYRGRIFLIFNDNTEYIWRTVFDNRDMFIAELIHENGRYSLSLPLKLAYGTVPVQKNWSPFEWNQNLFFSYSVNPHEVIHPNLRNGLCYQSYKTEGFIDWEFGTLRGSTPPILDDGEYLAFFHSARKMSTFYTHGWPLWHYFAGAYTFSAEPPFEMKKISPFPIVEETFYGFSNTIKRVIFPGGIVICGNAIYMAYGKDDCEIWIATLDKEALKNSLVPVQTK